MWASVAGEPVEGPGLRWGWGEVRGLPACQGCPVGEEVSHLQGDHPDHPGGPTVWLHSPGPSILPPALFLPDHPAGCWAVGPGEGVWTGESAENLQAWGLGDLPGTLSLIAAFSSFPDELPYLKCPLHTVLKLTPVAYGKNLHLHLGKGTYRP